MFENCGLDLEFLKNVSKATRHLDELVINTDRIANRLEAPDELWLDRNRLLVALKEIAEGGYGYATTLAIKALQEREG